MDSPSTYFQKIYNLLSKEFPLQKTELITELSVCESLLARLLLEKNELRQKLVLERERFRQPTEKGITDFDRRTMLEADTADHQKRYDDHVSLSDSLSSRITSLRLLLSIIE